jgi:site-specific DNA-cytosine methylase
LAFDGNGCGRIALDRAGVKFNKYYASEIDRYAIKVTQHNCPDVIQVGDIKNIKGTANVPQVYLVADFENENFKIRTDEQ